MALTRRQQPTVAPGHHLDPDRPGLSTTPPADPPATYVPTRPPDAARDALIEVLKLLAPVDELERMRVLAAAAAYFDTDWRPR